MTVPLDTVNDIRSMDAAGRSRSEIARVLHVSRNTVAKYADMEDMSPAAPMPQRRGRPALEGNEEWVIGVLEADLGAPRKQRHTARRIYDRLVAERGYADSYSTVQRFVRELRHARTAAGGEGYLELEWAPGTCQVDFGNFGLATLMWTVPGGAQETGGPYMRDPRHPRHFTDEFKRQIVDLYNAGKPKREIMDEYDLGKSTVERWIKSINATGSPRAACNRTPEQNRILELERENRRLRMEVDVLKQAALIYARK